MKYAVLSCILFFCTLQMFSQQQYFTYLQTDNNQPFYLRINNHVYSSTESGFLILSKLPDNDATLPVTIGFAKSVFPEQQFYIPANHKDAGYTIKNLGDQGWQLINLQTQAVIINHNPPSEKKKSELTGEKKTDAFSMLLAKAVNDTAVLYTVIKPPKPVAPPVVDTTKEKQRDSILLAAKIDSAKKDSALFVKRTAEKKDSIAITNANKPKIIDQAVTAKNENIVKDSVAITKKSTFHPVAKNDSLLISKNIKHRKDTIIIGDNARESLSKEKQTIAKNKTDSLLLSKNIKNRKDTIIIGENAHVSSSKEKQSVNKNKTDSLLLSKNAKHRKDTIIMMTPANEPVVKSTPPTKNESPLIKTAKDSSQFVTKEIVQAPVEKKDTVLVNKKIVAENIPPMKDSSANSLTSKKDTAATIGVVETIKPSSEKPDTISSIAVPVKRQRPLINKAAELLTDTSYVAVFVDESKDKFDTIRISIPFKEEILYSKKQDPVIKPADSSVSIAANQSNPLNLVNQPALVVPAKNDSLVKDSSAGKPTQQTVIPIVKADTATIVKQIKDSALTATVSEPALALPKKDSATAATQVDTSKAIKTQPQILYANSDCQEMAADNDIDELRIKMLLVSSDEDRIALAKKLFKRKCFLVKHVRALSELFKNDEGKYRWLDAVYPYVFDTGNFSSLSDIITDAYYLNRFKAMLRH